MTTPTNPNPPLGDPDDMRGLPTHEIPWQQTGYRDENARLLVDAIYRHRVTLMRRHADVPVQGYEVLGAEEGASGAMTCGVLISLWLGCAKCRGECPVCHDLVLAFAVGGFEDQWMVTGVCTGCGFLSHRASPKTELLAELNRGLRQTPCPLLSASQFLASNGHQHLAAGIRHGAPSRLVRAPAAASIRSAAVQLQSLASNPKQSWNADLSGSEVLDHGLTDELRSCGA